MSVDASIDTIITAEYLPADQEEAERIAAWLDRLAERFELWDPDMSVRVSSGRTPGRVCLGSYGHEYTYDGLDILARVLSRLLPGEIRVEEKGWHDDLWGETATYQAGRKVRAGSMRWVETETQET